MPLQQLWEWQRRFLAFGATRFSQNIFLERHATKLRSFQTGAFLVVCFSEMRILGSAGESKIL